MPEQLDPTILTEWKRMCNTVTSCHECALNDADYDIVTCDVNEVAGVISDWSAAHPLTKPKTRKDIFIERNPNAALDESNHPRCCPHVVGLMTTSTCEYRCGECWDEPYSE